MSEQPHDPTKYDPGFPPEPEQHPQVLDGTEADVSIYPDQTPKALDDEQVQL